MHADVFLSVNAAEASVHTTDEELVSDQKACVSKDYEWSVDSLCIQNTFMMAFPFCLCLT